MTDLSVEKIVTDEVKVVAEFMGCDPEELMGSVEISPMRYETIFAEVAKRIMALEQPIDLTPRHPFALKVGSDETP